MADDQNTGASGSSQRTHAELSPREVRERIGAVPGTRLVWHVMPNGSLIVRAKTRSLLDLAGSLKSPDGKRVAIEDMNGWR